MEPAMKPTARTFALAAALLLAAGPALADAREEVLAAAAKFMALKTYHVTITPEGKTQMKMEADFVAPDRFRMKMPMGTQYIIGDTIYMTVDGRTMKLPMQANMVNQWRDPARLRADQAKMTATALGPGTVDGKPAQKYRMTHADSPGTTSTMWVGANGYPLQIVVEGKSKTGETTIRYSRLNDPSIRIDPPK